MSGPLPRVRLVPVPALGRAPGSSHLAEVRGGRTVSLSGQIAVDGRGEAVGVGDFTAQARKVFHSGIPLRPGEESAPFSSGGYRCQNIGLALAEVGLTFGAVVELTVFLTDLAHLPHFRTGRDEFVDVASPPASSLARPELLIEVEAVAAAP